MLPDVQSRIMQEENKGLLGRKIIRAVTVDTPDQRSTPDPDANVAAVRRGALLLRIAGVILVLDIVSKLLAVSLLETRHTVSLIGDTVTCTLVRNSGATFGMATGYPWILTLIAAAVVIAMIGIGLRLTARWWAVGLGLILGGAVGNLVDRVFRSPGLLRGQVVDFVSIGWWPVFNLADTAVVAGATLLMVMAIRRRECDKTTQHGATTPQSRR